MKQVAKNYAFRNFKIAMVYISRKKAPQVKEFEITIFSNIQWQTLKIPLPHN